MIPRCLRSSIEGNDALYVCGEAENGKVAVDKVNELRPDTVILDLQMPVMNGLEAARQISKCAPKTVMLMFTMHRSDQLLKDAHAVGIQEVFSKTDSGPSHLLAWLRKALFNPEISVKSTAQG
jgi:DNA-binding NarL/FixJ family response regulator